MEVGTDQETETEGGRFKWVRKLTLTANRTEPSFRTAFAPWVRRNRRNRLYIWGGLRWRCGVYWWYWCWGAVADRLRRCLRCANGGWERRVSCAIIPCCSHWNRRLVPGRACRQNCRRGATGSGRFSSLRGQSFRSRDRLLCVSDGSTSAKFNHVDGALFARDKMTTRQKYDLAWRAKTHEALGRWLVLGGNRDSRWIGMSDRSGIGRRWVN